MRAVNSALLGAVQGVLLVKVWNTAVLLVDGEGDVLAVLIGLRSDDAARKRGVYGRQKGWIGRRFRGIAAGAGNGADM